MKDNKTNTVTIYLSRCSGRGISNVIALMPKAV
jgi:hypothetical protein